MVVRKDIDNSSAVLTVTITRDVLKAKLDAELKRLRQNMPVKGFRPGTVPMDYLKKMYGSAVFTETLNDLFSDALVKYLQESRLNVLGQPLPSENQEQKFTININNPDPEYVIEYEVGFVPSFELNGIDQSHSYEMLTVSNLDDLAEDDLQYARKRMGRTTFPTEDIQDKDMVKIQARELESEKGGVKEGGLEATLSFLLSQVENEDFKKQLTALKQGDTLRFNARTAEGKDSEEKTYRKYILGLADDDTREVGDWFEGTIEEVSRVSDAELDGEFFSNYFGGGVNSKDEAMEVLKQGIQRFYTSRAEMLFFRGVQERLMELNNFELPEKFLKRWLGIVNKDKISPEQIEAELPAFLSNLRWSILRDELMEEFGVSVSEAEVKERFADRIRNYYQVDLPDHIMKNIVSRMMNNKKELDDTRQELELDRIIQAVKGQVTIVEKPVHSEEFHKIVDEVTQKAKAEQGAALQTTLDAETEEA